MTCAKILCFRLEFACIRFFAQKIGERQSFCMPGIFGMRIIKHWPGINTKTNHNVRPANILIIIYLLLALNGQNFVCDILYEFIDSQWRIDFARDRIIGMMRNIECVSMSLCVACVCMCVNFVAWMISIHIKWSEIISFDRGCMDDAHRQ